MTDVPAWARKSKSGWAAFQARHGLAPDGCPGLKSLAAVEALEAALGQRPASSEPPPEGYSYGGEEIRRGVSRDPGLLLPGFAAKIETLFLRMREQGHSPILWEAYRSPERAQALSDKGAGIKLSLHCLGGAVDILEEESYWSADRSFWDALGANAKALGLTWGGDWRRRDFPHVQCIAVAGQARFRRMSDDERRALVA